MQHYAANSLLPSRPVTKPVGTASETWVKIRPPPDP